MSAHMKINTERSEFKHSAGTAQCWMGTTVSSRSEDTVAASNFESSHKFYISKIKETSMQSTRLTYIPEPSSV